MSHLDDGKEVHVYEMRLNEGGERVNWVTFQSIDTYGLLGQQVGASRLFLVLALMLNLLVLDKPILEVHKL